jgi:asparagine synthase (glutamine-hydrolysing)
MIRPRFLAGVCVSAQIRARLRAIAIAAKFAVLSDTDDLLLATTPETPAIKIDANAFVIGAVFARSASARVHTLCASTAASIRYGRIDGLLAAYWGDYVAFLRANDAVRILRAPFGTLPCLWRAQTRGIVFASDMDTLKDADSRPLGIDEAAVARHLLTADMRDARTCIDGISDLRGGSCLTAGPAAVSCKGIWTPWAFVPRDDECGADKIPELRERALACIAARTDHLAHPLLMLSGGLDSSIIAACLAQRDQRFTGLNLATSDAAGDERSHARSVAAHTRSWLIERRMATAGGDLGTLAAVRVPRPVGRSFEQHLYQTAQDVAHENGCDGILDGGGGDNLFCLLRSPSPAADCLLMPGARRHFPKTCANLSRLTGASSMDVAWRAVRRAGARMRPYRWPCDSSLLNPELRPLAYEAVRHPWLDVPRPGFPGRAAHIALLIAAQGYAEDGPYGTKTRSTAPLLSQPLIEHCVSISSWRWFRDGYDRAAARRAFEDMLPRQVAWRRDKGAPDSFVIALLEHNRPLIRDHLLGGVLAEARLLDLAAVERAIGDDRPARGPGYSRIMTLFDAEIWAQGIKAG